MIDLFVGLILLGLIISAPVVLYYMFHRWREMHKTLHEIEARLKSLIEIQLMALEKRPTEDTSRIDGNPQE